IIVAGRSTGSLGVMDGDGPVMQAARVADAEAHLQKLIEGGLAGRGETGELIFFNSHNLPKGYRANLVPGEAEQLFQLASECAALREQLDEPLMGSVAQLYLSACREASSENEHRRGPRQLSTWLLEEIKRS